MVQDNNASITKVQTPLRKNLKIDRSQREKVAKD